MGWSLFYPVGLNDVRVLGGGPPKEGEDYREWTRCALDGLESGELDLEDPADLNFPLARLVCDRLADESLPASEVVLFASDQEAEPYRRRDTVHAAAVLGRYFEYRLGEGTDIRVEHLDGNPSDYGQMVAWMREFAGGRAAGASDAGSLVILGPGTPAMSTALALVFSHLDGRARAWYISKSAGAQDVDLLVRLERERWERALRELIEAGDFRGARNVLRPANIEDKSLVPVLGALGHLVTFSPENAANTLKTYEGDGFGALGAFIGRVNGGAPGARMALLVANIKARYDAGYRVEALALASRFSEGLMKLVVFNELGSGTTGRKRGLRTEDFIELAKRDGEFWERLLEVAERRGLKLRRASWVVLKAALEVLAEQRESDRVEAALEAARTFRETTSREDLSLSKLRNETAYGHGFRGVGSSDLRDVLGDRSLPAAVDHFYRGCIGGAPEDVFGAARRELLERISSVR